jgi:predicted Zn-dependent protease
MEQQQINQTQKEYIQEKLQELVQENKISYFRILDSTARKSNFYVEKEYSIESILKSQRNELYVTLKTLDGEQVGESTFTITPQDNTNIIDSEIKDAIFICSQSKNQKYEDIKSDDSRVGDSHIDYNSFLNKNVKSDFEHNTITLFIEEKLQNFKKIIEEESNDSEQIRLNAMEVLVSIGEKKLVTSTGISKEYEKDSSYLEIVLTAIQKGGNESEHILYQKINELYKFDFESFLKDAILKIKDALHAKKAQSFEGEITLKGTGCTDFFIPDLTMNSFIGHCSSRLKYQKVTNYEIGTEPIKAKKDKLTVYFDPLLPQNNASTPFDLDGLAAHKVRLIHQNKIEKFFASSQYAQYLDIEATGPMGSIEIEPGSLNEELKDGIEIHTFSSFVPDMLSGNFSAEVRLGYTIKDGVKTPFKGGLFTGNIFKLLEDCELSKEIIEESGYKGPKAIKFYKGELVGL